MNSISLIGNISTDIDLRATPTGKFVAKFNVAVNNPYKRDKTSFIPVEVWGKSGENTASFCHKGSKVGINGYLEIDQYEKDGQKRSFTKVIADRIDFLDGKKDSQQQRSGSTPSDHSSNPFSDYGQTVEISDESLPF